MGTRVINHGRSRSLTLEGRLFLGPTCMGRARIACVVLLGSNEVTTAFWSTVRTFPFHPE